MLVRQLSHLRLTLATGVLLGGVSSCASDRVTTIKSVPASCLGTHQALECENHFAGDIGWYTPPDARATSAELALWASPYAASPGDTLDLFVHSTAASASVVVYRLGWYGGRGARRVWQSTTSSLAPQPSCSAPFPGPVVCPWKRSLRLPLDESWPSGVYLIKITNEFGRSSAYPFVVRSTQSSEVLAVIPQFTWQAYNGFGGSSLYVIDPSTNKNVHKVSFERPYDRSSGASFLYQKGLSNDIEAIRWLERNGYDVGYVSDLDLANPRLPPPASKVLLFTGHDEYWTWQMYDQVQRLRDSGTSLVFLSGNNAYWNVRLSAGAVTGRAGTLITCFKSPNDPEATTAEETTTRFRDPPLNRPENGLIGVMMMHLVKSGTTAALVTSDSGVGPQTQQFLDDAGLQPGDSIPGEIAVEGDEVVSNGHTPANLQLLFRSPITSSDGRRYLYSSAFFIAPSGAAVFASGTNEFGRDLDSLFAPAPTSDAISRLTKSVLDWMLNRLPSPMP